MAMEIIVHPGVDSAFIAWRAPFIDQCRVIDQCRGFALKRKVKRAPGSAVSPNTTSGPDAQGFVEEIVASWVGFADGPDVDPGYPQAHDGVADPEIPVVGLHGEPRR